MMASPTCPAKEPGPSEAASQSPEELRNAATVLVQRSEHAPAVFVAMPSPTEDLEAALALTGLRLPAVEPPPARKLAQLPGATSSWPFAEGKGCFIKNRDGKDVSFLERLYHLLSLPNLVLPGHPGRRLGEAIRWKSPSSLRAAGLPEDFAAFEIGDVALLEAAIYPQYASGAPLPCPPSL